MIWKRWIVFPLLVLGAVAWFCVGVWLVGRMADQTGMLEDSAQRGAATTGGMAR